MCLAAPMKIVEINGTEGAVEAGGVRQSVSFVMLADVKPGDYVIVHAGYAIEKLDEKEALETLRLLHELTETTTD